MAAGKPQALALLNIFKCFVLWRLVFAYNGRLLISGVNLLLLLFWRCDPSRRIKKLLAWETRSENTR
jgi:hypothetical protein